MKKQSCFQLSVLCLKCHPGVIFSNSESNNWDLKTKIGLICSTAWYRVRTC